MLWTIFVGSCNVDCTEMGDDVENGVENLTLCTVELSRARQAHCAGLWVPRGRLTGVRPPIIGE